MEKTNTDRLIESKEKIIAYMKEQYHLFSGPYQPANFQIDRMYDKLLDLNNLYKELGEEEFINPYMSKYGQIKLLYKHYFHS